MATVMSEDTLSSGMKSCPACAEKIREAAVKCRFCGENLTGKASSLKAQSAVRFPSLGKVWLLVVGLVVGLVVVSVAGWYLYENPDGLYPILGNSAMRDLYKFKAEHASASADGFRSALDIRYKFRARAAYYNTCLMMYGEHGQSQVLKDEYYDSLEGKH